MSKATVLQERAERLYTEAKKIVEDIDQLEIARKQLMKRHAEFREKLRHFEREWKEADR